jgi:hypothetical protein
VSFKDCISSVARQGRMSQEVMRNLHIRHDELISQGLSPDQVRARMIQEMQAEVTEEMRRGLLMETKKIGLLNTVFSYRDARGRVAPHKALWMLIEHFGHMGSQMDVQNLMDTIVRRAQEELEGLLWEGRKGWITGELRRKGPEMVARMDNIARELFGQFTGDVKAKQIADAWTRMSEKLRLRFNEAGGLIGKLKDWGLPQRHNAEAIQNAGGHPPGSKAAKDYWIQYTFARLDRERMVNVLTGIRMTDKELAESLSHVFDTIVSEGRNKLEPSYAPQGKGALYKQHADHRFLHFKDADSWLDYQKTFGEGDVFGSMMSHIRMMGRDIAAMETLGPNPDAMLNLLKQEVLKSEGRNDEVNKAFHKLDGMWAHYRGEANVPVSSKWAKIMAAGRNWISATSLGSAAITALSDHATDAVTRAYVGLPVTRAFTGWLQQMGPNAERHAARNGVILSSAMSTVFEEARFFGATSARTWTGYINDRVLSLSGLNAMTEGRKAAFGLDFQATAADLARFTWNEMGNQGGLAAAFRRTLERHGFDAASWDLIRVADQEQPSVGDGFVGPAGLEGTGFLRAQEIEKVAGRELADRYHAMVLREMRRAVVESTLGSRAAIVGTNQPGTLAGELLKSGGQFKSFGVGFMMLHGERVFRELVGGNKARGAIYAGALLSTATLFGGLALQLKEIANGRDPRRVDLDKKGLKFWGAALLQGGGLGIYGDFLFADVNRFGGGLAVTVAGPMVDKVGNVLKLTTGNLIEFAQGEERTNFGRELSQFIRGNTPGLSSWWFAREAYNRILMDQLQYMMDSDAHTSFRRQMQRRRTDYRQDFFWRPGESEPRRGPDFGAMFP